MPLDAVVHAVLAVNAAPPVIMATHHLRPLSRTLPGQTRPKIASSVRTRLQNPGSCRGKATKASNVSDSGASRVSQTEQDTLPWQEYLAIRKRKRRWETVRIHSLDGLFSSRRLDPGTQLSAMYRYVGPYYPDDYRGFRGWNILLWEPRNRSSEAHFCACTAEYLFVLHWLTTVPEHRPHARLWRCHPRMRRYVSLAVQGCMDSSDMNSCALFCRSRIGLPRRACARLQLLANDPPSGYAPHREARQGVSRAYSQEPG